MREMKKITYILFAFLLLTGCIKDNTVTEFKDVELPVLNNPDKDPDLLMENHQYTVKYGDVLEIKPAITYSDMSNLSYRWTINGETVSEEKDLNWKCNLKENGAGALYITRISAGSSVIIPFSIILDRPYERGWVIVVDKGGKVNYDFLQEVPGRPYQYNEYPDFLKTESSAETWIDCIEFWSNESKSVRGHMMNLDKNLDHCINVEELTMIPTVTLKQEFLGEKIPEGVGYFQDALYAGYVAYLLGDNGKLYGRKGGDGYYTGKFFDLPVQFEGKDLQVSELIDMPYNAGMAMIYDKVGERFLTISNGFGTGSNERAGMISTLPVSSTGSSALNDFKGEDIVYHRFLLPAGWGESNLLFIVSKNLKTGVYSASEYSVELAGNGIVADVTTRYSKRPIPHFGDKSQITVLENPYGFVGENVYYTDGEDPSILYYCKRSRSGLDDIEVYRKFDAPVVSLDQGKIQSSFQNIGVALENGSVHIMNVSKVKDKYVEAEGDQPNSYLYEWKGIKGKILKLDFRYGNVSNYFS